MRKVLYSLIKTNYQWNQLEWNILICKPLIINYQQIVIVMKIIELVIKQKHAKTLHHHSPVLKRFKMKKGKEKKF